MFSRPSRTDSRNTLRLAVETVEAGAIQRAESQGCTAIHPKPAREMESDSDTPYDRCCGIAGSNDRSSFHTPGRLAARECCTTHAFPRHLEQRPAYGLGILLFFFLGAVAQEDASASPSRLIVLGKIWGNLLRVAVMSISWSNTLDTLVPVSIARYCCCFPGCFPGSIVDNIATPEGMDPLWPAPTN